MTVTQTFKQLKAQGKKITVVTSYDYWSASIISKSDVDGILVGDCGSMVINGHQNTLQTDIEFIETGLKAVSKAAPDKFIIAAVPFLAHRKDFATAVENVERLIKAGAKAVKIEGVKGNERLIHHLCESGIPVVGHIGLTPQSHHMVGGFRMQGRNRKEMDEIVAQGKILEQLGCCCVVLEAVPAIVGKELSKALQIPVVGVGAGLEVDGQALVLQDMMGMSVDFLPKFVRLYMKGADLITNAVNRFVDDVHTLSYPAVEETYSPVAKTQVRKLEQKQPELQATAV